MRSIIAPLLLCIALALAFGSGATAESTGAVSYNANGAQGVLLILDQPGEAFQAFNRFGSLVAGGVVTGATFSVPASNAGPAEAGWLLRVNVGGTLYFVADKEWIWE